MPGSVRTCFHFLIPFFLYSVSQNEVSLHQIKLITALIYNLIPRPLSNFQKISNLYLHFSTKKTLLIQNLHFTFPKPSMTIIKTNKQKILRKKKKEEKVKKQTHQLIVTSPGHFYHIAEIQTFVPNCYFSFYYYLKNILNHCLI